MVPAVPPSVPSSDDNNDVGSGGLGDGGTLKTPGKYVRLVLSSLLIAVVVSHRHQLSPSRSPSSSPCRPGPPPQKKQKCVFCPWLTAGLAESTCLQCSKRIHEVDWVLCSGFRNLKCEYCAFQKKPCFQVSIVSLSIHWCG